VHVLASGRSFTTAERDPASSALYHLVASQRATFARVTDQAGGAPAFVDAAFARYLRCGILSQGFARYGCTTCGHDHLLPLSCKTRGLCPSCGGRRMAALTEHIMNRELPRVAVRQWVLSLPFPLRYTLAYDQRLCTAVHRVLARVLRARLRKLARGAGCADADTGSVTFVQRYGGGLNLNVHYHLIGVDGWFSRTPTGELRFTQAPAPSQRDVTELVLVIQKRVLALLAREGLLDEGEADALQDEAPALADCYSGAVTQRVGLGPQRGRPVMKIRDPLKAYLASAPGRVTRGGLLCAHVDGFDLHGRVAFGAHQRARITQLVRYCARPPLANGRLKELPSGHYLLALKGPWRDGTTHLKFEPIELMERLAAQIPKPRANLVLYAGVLAPNAKSRPEVVALAAASAESAREPRATQSRGERETWAELMRVTFERDVLLCPRCGGRLRHVATLLDAASARAVLAHLGLPVRGPPMAPAGRPPFWAITDDELEAS
jgi:DNA-directed RNA polymerase subunit RPC12/RpoP